MKHGKNGLVKQMFNRFNVNIRDTLYNNNQHCGKKNKANEAFSAIKIVNQHFNRWKIKSGDPSGRCRFEQAQFNSRQI